MKKLFIVAAVFALLNVFTAPASAFSLRIETTREAPTVPAVGKRGYMWLDGRAGTRGFCWDGRDGAGQCQYH